jgi:hypothetical protein
MKNSSNVAHLDFHLHFSNIIIPPLLMDSELCRACIIITIGHVVANGDAWRTVWSAHRIAPMVLAHLLTRVVSEQHQRLFPSQSSLLYTFISCNFQLNRTLISFTSFKKQCNTQFNPTLDLLLWMPRVCTTGRTRQTTAMASPIKTPPGTVTMSLPTITMRQGMCLVSSHSLTKVP